MIINHVTWLAQSMNDVNNAINVNNMIKWW